MPKFAMVFHRSAEPDPTKVDPEKLYADWGKWYESIADVIAEMGAPVKKSWTVDANGASEGVASHPVSGYSVINAADYAAACDIASGCPDVAQGFGWVEVAEVVEM